MADNLQATPRNQLLGLLSDAMYGGLDWMKSPERTQQMQGLAGLLESTRIPQTTQRMAYGEPLTNIGRANVPLLKPETAEALMNIAPLMPAAGRLASRAGRAVGRMAGEEISAAMSGLPTRSLLGEITPKPKLLDVYHGTPHTLPPTPRNPLGEFDASKIGTGEGAQAYGYGIYTAEAPDVAKGYARNLANADKMNQGRLTAHANAQRLAELTGSPQYAADDIRFVLESNPDHEQKKLLNETLKFLESGDYKKPLENKGNLYKVDLPDEKIATMLDWDKPLSQQSPQVQAALKGIEQDLPSIPNFDLKKWMDADPLASTWHNVLARDLKVEPSKIAELLQNKGVAGIRYLDEGSRATTGKQTSNFVVFPNEEKSMTILERNGVRAFPQEFSYPQQAALDLAQQRAALPVSEGGLGLPPNNTPEMRAQAMGFDTEAYHGTNANVPVFDISKNITAKDIYSSPNPSEASAYATSEGGNVMPLLLRGEVKDLTKESQYVDNQLRKAYNAQVSKYERQYYPFEQFKESFMRGQLYQDTGGQSAQNALVGELIGNRKSILKIPDAVSDFGVGQSYVTQNPANIRSRFAAFDPFRKDVATATAMGVALPDLLAAEPTPQPQSSGLLYPFP